MHLTEVYILAHPELKDSREAEGPYINLRDVNEESTNKIQQNQLKVGWCFGPPALKSCCFFWRKIVKFTGSPNDADANSFWGSGSQKRQDTSEKTTEQWRKMLLLWISSVGIIPFGYRVIFNSVWTAQHGNPVLNWPGCEWMLFLSCFFVLFTTQWWSFLRS